MRHTRIIVTYYGGPDALRVVEEECPEPKDGEVRVRVLAAGVSLPDLLMREGVHIAFCPQSFLFEREEEAHQRCLGIDISSQPIL
jgi:NADPH:quinone reductase-like Zn-dependent oxidoreductase